VPVVATTRTTDQCIPENNKKMFEVAKDFLATLLFTINPWLLTKEEKHKFIPGRWKLTIEAQECQRQIASTLDNSRLICQQPGVPSKVIDIETQVAVSLT
jgi:hypothetical protein